MTTTATHTPGPWSIGTAAEGRGISITGPGGKGTIAFVRDTQHPLTAVTEYEAGANARLIAAAPEMAEFLRYLTEHTLGWADVRDRARALLARIEGRP